MQITPDEGLTEQQRAELVDAMDAAELRPSMLTGHAPETLRAYRKRRKHYSVWCLANGFQPQAEHITTETVEAYTRAQCEAAELRPTVLWQALNALTWYGERVTGRAPDVRQAKELVRLYRDRRTDKAYTVGHQVHRPRMGRQASG